MPPAPGDRAPEHQNKGREPFVCLRVGAPGGLEKAPKETDSIFVLAIDSEKVMCWRFVQRLRSGVKPGFAVNENDKRWAER